MFYKMVIFSCAFLSLIHCRQNEKNSNMQPIQSSKEKMEHNKALARKWILEAWNQNRNQELVADVFAQDWVDGNPTFADQPKGIEGAMYYVNVYRKIFPDIQFQLSHLIAEEEFVCFRFTATSTHEGEFMGIPPTHKKVQFSGIVIHRIEDGKFAESWNEIDLLGIRQQLTSN